MSKTLFFLLGWLVLSPQPLVFGQLPQQDLADYLSPATTDLPNVSAHRGGRFYHGLPENSLGLFRHVSSHVSAFIECDVQMSKDSTLFLLHDDSLDRTTTGTGLAREKDWRELQQYALVDDYGTVTEEKIPSLESIFRWAKGNTILALDIKDGLPIELLVDLIREYRMENSILLIAYNLEEAIALHSLAPEMVLSVSMEEVEDIAAHEAAGIPLRQCVAFTGTRIQSPALYTALRENGILSIMGTMREADLDFRDGDEDVYKHLFHAGIDILATDHPLEASARRKRQNIRARGLDH